MQPNNNKAITIADFCSKYQIHRSTFYRNLKRGLMPPIIKIGKGSRILFEDEQAWLEKHRTAVPEAA